MPATACWWATRLHTAHFSIGSGTRLALEDVIALVERAEVLRLEGRMRRCLPTRHSANRCCARSSMPRCSSARWYEDFDKHMALEPWAFALSYIRRAGRLDAARLAAMAPVFANGLATRGIGMEA
jgi:hypothetical protein